MTPATNASAGTLQSLRRFDAAVARRLLDYEVAHNPRLCDCCGRAISHLLDLAGRQLIIDGDVRLHDCERGR